MRYAAFLHLPNAPRAFIDLRKLTEYCLDPTHPVGRHKSIVFRRALGFTATDALLLSNLILRAAVTEDATFGQLDQFGQRFTVDFWVSTTVGSIRVRTAWIVRATEDFPRLTTCFVIAD